MIDWVLVGFGALWILGLGVALAALSYANYLAGQDKRPFVQVLSLPGYQIVINLGLALFCTGWAGSVSTGWERLLWIVLALLFAWQAWQVGKTSSA